MFDECINDRFTVLIGYLDQHNVASLTFDESRNLAAGATAQEITIPNGLVPRGPPRWRGAR